MQKFTEHPSKKKFTEHVNNANTRSGITFDTTSEYSIDE